MLFVLRDYLAKEKYVSLEQAARCLKIDATALEPMFDFWIARGVILPSVSEKSCGAVCKGCQPKAAKYYQYAV
ncbi:MAG: FeoC-like transcriptional regulator [Gammaproteobacteria bacterium]|nr:FeoC-like transcriptional regulator [Gammaproteobacteria bacterium]MCH9715637.1 FeoC-like transcriptional regulator [Gammaproteobacteria bacterium]MCH9763966.1 FeoC-like transcriptional regulator [Gammaproteobacteria bacterium]